MVEKSSAWESVGDLVGWEGEDDDGEEDDCALVLAISLFPLC